MDTIIEDMEEAASVFSGCQPGVIQGALGPKCDAADRWGPRILLDRIRLIGWILPRSVPACSI